MKKAIVVCVAFLLMAACTSTSTQLTTAGNPGEVPLSAAIRDAATLMETRLDQGTKIALISFTSPSEAFSEYVLDELSSVLVNDGALVVVDRASLDKVRQELDFNMSGEVSDESAQEIGKMLGAQAIVTGRLTGVGDLYRVMFKTIITQTAAVAAQDFADVINDRRMQALLAESGNPRSLTYGGTNSAAAEKSAVPAGPKNGTYTFFPRPQVKKAGIPDEGYIVKVVVSGKNMLIYLTNVPRGLDSRANPGYWYGPAQPLLTDLDNPAKTWKPVAHKDNPDGNRTGEVLSFENVTATRFSLECNWYTDYIFDEIILGDPDA